MGMATMANKNIHVLLLFMMLVGCVNRFYTYWNSFLLNSIDSLCLQLTQVARPPDLGNIRVYNDGNDRTDYSIPLVHARGVIKVELRLSEIQSPHMVYGSRWPSPLSFVC